jgi:eukaryotic-like serine/threonine-protein kinase
MAGTLLKSKQVVGNRYVVETFVGEGGMQEVYRAIDRSFGRSVALKAPKNPSAKKRFDRSARMSAKVNHPNVAKTLDYIEEGGSNYLIEEFIEGSDLQARLNTEFYFLDPHLAAHVAHHLAKGISASHHVGVFHRDLKPSNIMVSHDPSLTVVKVTDFGIAKMAETEIDDVMNAGDDESITGSKTVVGALPYMAPEMITNSRSATLSADIWALGALLFHLLVGERPFGQGLQAIPKIVKRDLPRKSTVLSPGTQFSGLIDELWAVIESCLQLDTEARPLADDLVKRFAGICYSTAPRMTGWIKNYRIGTGDWGFIGSTEESDCFFHKESFYGNKPEPGMAVNFAPFPGDPSPRAFPVLPLRPADSKALPL